MPKPQSFENHTKLVPLFHGFVLPVLAANLIRAAFRLYGALSFDTVLAVLVALALIVLALFARVFALTVQDRVIRLEMRLRLARLAPALQSQLDQFTVAQLVALRFASDEELPDLATRVLRDNLQNKTAIKKLIQRWEADHQRA
jgi:hypothetical protein